MDAILVLDDSHEFRHYACETLQPAGFEVALALDGDHALRKLGRQPFGALVMETAPDGGGGLGVLRRIRRQAPNLPVIAVASHPSLETEEACADFGVRAYLHKPVAPAVLLSAVQAAVGHLGDALPSRTEPGRSGLRQSFAVTAARKAV